MLNRKAFKKKYLFLFLIPLLFIFIIWSAKSSFVHLSRKPNIILIVIDSLRADHLNCYGYVRKTSPNIDKLAKEGIKFTQVISAGGWTTESVPSILTGVYPITHQIHDWNDLRNPYISTLAQELTKESYRCVLWSNHPSLKFFDIEAYTFPF